MRVEEVNQPSNNVLPNSPIWLGGGTIHPLDSVGMQVKRCSRQGYNLTPLASLLPVSGTERLNVQNGPTGPAKENVSFRRYINVAPRSAQPPSYFGRSS
jgi:hypothetical protein